MFPLAGGIFLGWALGANDTSNVIGPAVTSRMLRFRTAAAIASFSVVAGALLQGRAGVETVSGLTGMDLTQAVISSVSAALAVTLMTVLRLPVSVSQAVIGSIIGIGIINREMDFHLLGKVLACWLGTPLGGAVMAVILSWGMAHIYNRGNLDMFQADFLMKIGLIGAGIYGSYALGSNNVANVTAVFVGAGHLTFGAATLVGGLSIGLGIITYSKKVMETVGTRLVRLDPFSALVVLLAEAGTVHLFTFVGVPVSTSQAVIGAVLGIGLYKGIRTVSRRTMASILSGWLLTPVLAGVLALVISLFVGR